MPVATIQLREDPPPFGPPGAAATPAGETDTVTRESPDKQLRCRSCGHAITREQDRMSMHGSHEHDFTNPHGFRFHIGCFSDAPGCVSIGESTAEHTWFAGYRWRAGVCKGCQTHLGWRFQSSGEAQFYGLILDRLIYPS